MQYCATFMQSVTKVLSDSLGQWSNWSGCNDFIMSCRRAVNIAKIQYKINVCEKGGLVSLHNFSGLVITACWKDK